MSFLSTYLNTLSARGNIELAESVAKTAEKVGIEALENFPFLGHKIGLLFGNVQSGKTAQMFAILCKAADIGFPLFVILATDNIALQQQTLERAKQDLTGFRICGENDSQSFREGNLSEPTIVILKKNARILKLWRNVLTSTGFMKGNPLFIVDDEADAASLNTLINKNKQSSVNNYLEEFRECALSSLYLQVTGTPQALLLQTMISGWRPYFIHYFKPGLNYLGGEYFFPTSVTPKCIEFINENDLSMTDIVLRHFTVAAQILVSGGKVCNCLVHPGIRQEKHDQTANSVREAVNWCIKERKTKFIATITTHYNSLNPTKNLKATLGEVLEKADKILDNALDNIYIMNGKNSIKTDLFGERCNFIIGGNSLGRGVTFPSLHTICYTRTCKKPQADTMWQHSRMFGYDRDKGLMKLFIPRSLYKLFTDINATNTSIISQIERGAENIKLYYPVSLKPTRSNVLDKKQLIAIPGGVNSYPMNPDNNTIDDISNLLKDFDHKMPYYQVNLAIFPKILQHIISSPDFNIDSYLSIIQSLINESPRAQGILIVRKDKAVTFGTGALLSANDWQLTSNFADMTVLVMYQITGKHGWKRDNIWVPNIKLPNNVIYYDVKDSQGKINVDFTSD